MGSIVIDTAQARPDDPVDFWRDEASRVFQPLNVRCDDRKRFWAHSVGYDLCDITLTRTRSEASTVVRTRRTIAEFDPDLLLLVLHLHGSYRVTHDERNAVCGAGDVAVIDSALPFNAHSEGPIDVLTVGLSKSLLPTRLARAAARSPLRIPGGTGPAMLVPSFLSNLLDGLHGGAIAPDDEGVADCVVSVVGALVGGQEPPRAPREQPLRDVKRWIDAHLADPDLSPARIAAANYISRRRLYTLFEAEGCGVSEWIRERRLEACRRDLRDPALSDETVMRVAMRWGFVDASHFSHSFSEAYGMPPGQYRAAASAAVAQRT